MRAHRPAAFRPDIEGLRAVAILAVVLYHAGVPGFGGGFVGVDLFFVLSGYLITGLLLREIGRTGRIDLPDFWARRLRRLLPAATVVLVATALVSGWVIAPAQRTEVATGIVYATFYAANWFFAGNALDYLATDTTASPVLHFWSLGVEEQFYLVWPLALLGLLALARRRGIAVRTLFVVAVVAVWVVSFGWSLYATTASQPLAFFGSPARFWQLATGALLAIAPVRLPRATHRAALALVGAAGLVAAIVLSGLLIERGHGYPGVIALLPTLATAALVAGGGVETSPVTRLLTRPWMLWLGGLSYSWYLWHWPVLVLGGVALGDIGVLVRLLLVALSLGLAFAANRWIENPVRFAAPLQQRASLSIAMGVVLMAGSVGAAQWLTQRDAEHLERSYVDANGITYRPLPSAAKNDLPSIYGDGCITAYEQTWNAPCVFGAADGERTVVLFGDSHAANLFEAVRVAAKREGLRLVVRIKTGCAVGDMTVWNKRREQPYTQCSAWRERVIAEIERTKPALVLVVNEANSAPSVALDGKRVADADAAERIWHDGFRSTLQALVATGSRVAVIRDNPFNRVDVPDCVSRDLAHPDACDGVRSEVLPEPPRDLEVARSVAGVRTVDLSDAVCGSQRCFTVVDNVFVWRDAHHYTVTFARTLADRMQRELAALL